jgi:hypothetical protein
VEWTYETVCGENGYIETPDGYYITETGLRHLRGWLICFQMGKNECRMSAEMLQGLYSDRYMAFKGTICSLGGGSAINDKQGLTYDIYGAVSSNTTFSIVPLTTDSAYRYS